MGGAGAQGFKSSLTRTVNALGRKLKLVKEEQGNLSGDHVREGLGAVISVKAPCLPRFASLNAHQLLVICHHLDLY